MQARNYVVAYYFSIGLLTNLGATTLQFKHIFNPKHHPANPLILKILLRYFIQPPNIPQTLLFLLAFILFK